MRQAGQIALLRLPGTDLSPGKPRPVVLIAPTPGPYDDWLVCMLSTQVRQALEEVGAIGDINPERLDRIRQKLSAWVRGT